MAIEWKKMRKRIKEVDEKLSTSEILGQEEYKRLQDEILINDKDLNSEYERFLAERENILPGTKEEREKIEAIIKYKILQIFKINKELSLGKDENEGFFKYTHFREIPEIKRYFNIFLAIGDRNIGKSTSAQEEVDKTIKRGKRFMWIRNIDDEVKAQLASDIEEGWLSKRGWTFKGSSKAPSIITPNNTLLGWYRPLNTSSKFKSVDFPDTELIVYEEFSEGNVKGKYHKFVKFASTTLRMNEGYAIMQANFTDQEDEIIQALGVGSKKLDYMNFVHFNWIVGAIIIFIPRGVYRQTKNKKKDLAYRASLADHNVFKSQYGGGFSNEEPVNIINDSEFVSLEPILNFYIGNAGRRSDVKRYGAFKITLYKVYDNDGKVHNVLTETLEENKKPIFVFESVNKVMYPNAQIVDFDALQELLYNWNTGNLKTTSLRVHQIITIMFANALKIERKEEGEISEVKDIFS